MDAKVMRMNTTPSGPIVPPQHAGYIRNCYVGTSKASSANSSSPDRQASQVAGQHPGRFVSSLSTVLDHPRPSHYRKESRCVTMQALNSWHWRWLCTTLLKATAIDQTSTWLYIGFSSLEQREIVPSRRPGQGPAFAAVLPQRGRR